MQLLTLEDFKSRFFPGKNPSYATLRRACERGELPARKLGKMWFIDSTQFTRSSAKSNPLLEKIIHGAASP